MLRRKFDKACAQESLKNYDFQMNYSRFEKKQRWFFKYFDVVYESNFWWKP